MIGPGTVRFGRVACKPSERLVGAWHSVAFRTKQPPPVSNAVYVKATHVLVGKKVVVTG